MGLMKLSKNLEKLAILKIGELVSLLTSVRNKLNLSLKYWSMEAITVFCMCLGPKRESKYHLETVQTIFSENNNYYRTIFVKLNFFHA
jgi:hypothetical protein